MNDFDRPVTARELAIVARDLTALAATAAKIGIQAKRTDLNLTETAVEELRARITAMINIVQILGDGGSLDDIH